MTLNIIREGWIMRFASRILTLVVVSIFALQPNWGCQHNDIAIPQDRANIVLDVVYLPELDTLYVYELWMVSTAHEGDDILAEDARFTSLGKFLWDSEVARFRDMDGTAIDNSFEVPGFWHDHDYIVVTVENRNDPYPHVPSRTYLLVDEVVDPELHPIVLGFPCDLFMATGFYFVGSPTDDTSYYDIEGDSVVRHSDNEGKGLWLCSRFYSEQPGNVQDTLGIIPDSEGNDSIYLEISTETNTGDIIYTPDIIGIVHPPGGWPSEVVTDTVVLGYDSIFDHRRVEFQYIDTIDINHNYVMRVVYDTLPAKTYGYFEYVKSLEELPNISPYGWRYNGWVFLEQPDPDIISDNSDLNLPPMIPFGKRWQERFVGDADWGVLPLGAFLDPERADFSNNYLDNREVPGFPGEDFVKNAAPRFASLNLRRDAVYEWGSVVIGIEPDPSSLMIDTAANFPILILSDFLHSASDNDVDEVQTFHNWTQFLPKIRVRVTFR
jgi:hypothetical protein